jgi:hypothetical protein
MVEGEVGLEDSFSFLLVFVIYPMSLNMERDIYIYMPLLLNVVWALNKYKLNFVRMFSPFGCYFVHLNFYSNFIFCILRISSFLIVRLDWTF